MTAISCPTSPNGFWSSIAGRAYPYKGNYEAWLEQKQALAEQQAKENASRKKLLEQELDWVRMNASSRLTKNKARLKRYDELAAQEYRHARGQARPSRFRTAGAWATSSWRPTGLTKAYGDRVLMEDVNFDLPRGGIVGVIGGNGAGKTTLFKMITGQEEPTGGRTERGRQRGHLLRRPAPRRPRPRQDRLGGDQRRPGDDRSGRPRA